MLPYLFINLLLLLCVSLSMSMILLLEETVLLSLLNCCKFYLTGFQSKIWVFCTIFLVLRCYPFSLVSSSLFLSTSMTFLRKQTWLAPKMSPHQCQTLNYSLYLMVLHSWTPQSIDKLLVPCNIFPSHTPTSPIQWTNLPNSCIILLNLTSTLLNDCRDTWNISFIMAYFSNGTNIFTWEPFQMQIGLGNRDGNTSTTPYIVYLRGNAISWHSRTQKSVARSSTEAK